MDNYLKHIRDERLKKIIRAQQVLMWIPVIGSAASIVLMQIVLYKRGFEKITKFNLALAIALCVLAGSYFLVSKLFPINPVYCAIIYIAALFFIAFFAAYTGLNSQIKIIYEFEQAQPLPAAVSERAAEIGAAADIRQVAEVASADSRDTALVKHEDMAVRHVSLYLTPEYVKKLSEAGCSVNFELFWVSGKIGKNAETLYSRPPLKRGYACYFSLSATGADGKKGRLFKLSQITPVIGIPKTYSHLSAIFEAVEKMTEKERLSSIF